MCLIFAAPRTGSSNLMKVLSGQSGVVALDEVFHPKVPCGQLDEECKVFLQDYVDTSRDDFAYSAPLETFTGLVDYFSQKGGVECLIFTIFPQHLGIVMLLEIFKRYMPGVVFLQRRPVDMFISQMKASKVKRYSHVDTTDEKITLDIKRFYKWYAGIHNWYAAMYSIVGKIEPELHFVFYERLYCQVRYQQELKKLLLFLEIPVNETSLIADALPRQDKSKNWMAKVSPLPQDFDLDFSLGFNFFENYFLPRD